MYRSILLPLLVGALIGAPAVARAQATGGGGRVDVSREDARTRRERLLLRIDSLRTEFERKRVDDVERERLALEMHRTVMALDESMEYVGAGPLMRARAGGVAPRVGEGQVAIALRGRFLPRGYLGVTFDGPSIDEIRSGERLVRFLEYPRIALVEPSSPADRAGIVQGDTLIALNGNDVRGREISLSKLLVPDRRLAVRVRREGNPVNFQVRIEEAPSYVMSRRAMPVATGPMRVYTDDDGMTRRVPMPANAPIALPRTSQPPGTSVWIFQDGVGGARLESINEGLGRALGTPSGVLVLRASPGTPAYESGLRDGDVILRVLGRDVANVRELRSALAESDRDDGVKLVILRDKKKRDLTLRW